MRDDRLQPRLERLERRPVVDASELHVGAARLGDDPREHLAVAGEDLAAARWLLAGEALEDARGGLGELIVRVEEQLAHEGMRLEACRRGGEGDAPDRLAVHGEAHGDLAVLAPTEIGEEELDGVVNPEGGERERLLRQPDLARAHHRL